MKKDKNYWAEYFPDNRNEGETMLEQTQIVLLRMLKIFHHICEENNLTYFLDSGTLLGAVRHGGYIPWDDDIDVVMPRKDYERLKIIAKDIIPDQFFFQCKDTVPRFKNNILRIIDRKSTAIARGKFEKDYKWHMGLFLDIFPMEYTNNPKVGLFFINLFYYNVKNKLLRFFVRSIRHLLVFLVSKPNVFKIAKHCFSLGNIKKKKYMSYGFELNWSPHNTYYCVDDVFPLKKMKFENYEFYVPKNSEKILTQGFGDYMKFPPKEDRVGHFKDVQVNKVCEFEKMLRDK